MGKGLKLAEVLYMVGDQFLHENTAMTLRQLYASQGRPGWDELLWEFVDMDDFDTAFPLVVIDPVDVWNNWRPDGVQLMKDVYRDYADREQMSLVRDLRREIKSGATLPPVVVFGDGLDDANFQIVDGFHRIAALALLKVRRHAALDIASDDSKELQ